jgi:hypothetical protein
MEWIYLLFSLLFIHVSALKIPIKRAGLVNRAIPGASIKHVSLASAAGNNSNLGSIKDIRVINYLVFLGHCANRQSVHDNYQGERSWYVTRLEFNI